MTTAGIIKLSLANIWRRKLRTLLTVWGMSVGIGAMVLLISFASGLQKENEEQLTSSMSLTRLSVSKEDMGGFRGGSSAPKTLETTDLDQLRAIPHVLAVYPEIAMPMTKIEIDGQRYDAFLQATPLEDITPTKREGLERGTWWTANDEAAIVVASTTVTTWKIDAANLVGKKITIVAQEFSGNSVKDGKSYPATIVGITKKSNSFMFGDFIGYDLAKKIGTENVQVFPGETPQTGTTSAGLYVDNSQNVTGVRAEIEKLGLFATGLDELLKQINQGFLIMKIVLGIIGGIALFVALIGIANSMLMAVLERTREIGIMTALGASRRTVSWLFLAEAAWLGFFGALLGILGALGLGKLITIGVGIYLSVSGAADEGLSFIKFSVGPILFLGTLIGAVVVTLIAGWLPARRAATLDPIKALRHE